MDIMKEMANGVELMSVENLESCKSQCLAKKCKNVIFAPKSNLNELGRAEFTLNSSQNLLTPQNCMIFITDESSKFGYHIYE